MTWPPSPGSSTEGPRAPDAPSLRAGPKPVNGHGQVPLPPQASSHKSVGLLHRTPCSVHINFRMRVWAVNSIALRLLIMYCPSIWVEFCLQEDDGASGGSSAVDQPQDLAGAGRRAGRPRSRRSRLVQSQTLPSRKTFISHVFPVWSRELRHEKAAVGHAHSDAQVSRRAAVSKHLHSLTHSGLWVRTGSFYQLNLSVALLYCVLLDQPCGSFRPVSACHVRCLW